MANKNLSAVIGSDNYDLGDLILTTATSLPSGRVLLDCDGSAFNITTYSELAAIIPATRGIGPVRQWKGFERQRMVSAKHYAVSPDGTQLLGQINENFDGTAQGGHIALANTATDAFVSTSDVTDDSNGQCFFVSEAVKGIIKYDVTLGDLVLEYRTIDDGNIPSSIRIIDTVDSHNSDEEDRDSPNIGSIVYTADTLEALICDVDASSGHAHCYYGTNAGGFWADSAWVASSDPTFAIENGHMLGYGVAIPDLSKSYWPTSGGVFVSTDTGATWATEQSMLPDDQFAAELAINTTEDVFAVSSTWDQIAKSTDDCVTWSTVLEPNDIVVPMPEGFGPIRFRDVKIDSTDRVYVIADANNGQYSIAIFYLSTDGGTTWTHMVQPTVEIATALTRWRQHGSSQYENYKNDPFTNINWAFNPSVESKHPAEFLRVQLKADGSKLYVNDRRACTVYEADITAASYLPYLPGHKIVADAP